ncbi:transketolase family protein [Conexibacter sp. CPCC 206217]|uniref:transketolase family protein n=1 Tax=Conexibacter sp. CPCC 206217 TaxID=3064574 RepID=UPI002727ECAC|nr:transketolase C-terminal domain-containing protein [Conexibacter sp. CPCC 206217]MDO8211736.1 transketolase C-terminal domain-containing protein [Conexibacter sp. CPCC 206217]
MPEPVAAPFRAPVPSDARSWDMARSEQLADSAVAGRVLADLADGDERIAVLTADLKFSNRTVDFERRHPERFLNVGIAEQHMVTMAAGMATFGYVPYVATFASFVGLLCAEQLRTDLAYPGLPVRVLAHHAGISLGFYGTSHHATEDLGLLRAMANMTVVCPCDAASVEQALRTTVDHDGPIYFRLGRGRDPQVYAAGAPGFEVGRIATLRAGGDLTIVANGITVSAALQAAEQLAADGIEAAVLDAHTVRPFDAETLCAAAAGSGRLLVAEEHNVVGGLASACADALVDGGIGDVRLARVGMPPDEYALIGPPTHLYRHYGLDADGLAARARDLLEQR